MQAGLAPWGQPRRRPVRVRIAGQQRDLEKKETGCPNRRRTAKPGEDEFPYQRLYLKQKKSSGKYRQGKWQHGAAGNSGRKPPLHGVRPRPKRNYFGRGQQFVPPDLASDRSHAPARPIHASGFGDEMVPGRTVPRPPISGTPHAWTGSDGAGSSRVRR